MRKVSRCLLAAIVACILSLTFYTVTKLTVVGRTQLSVVDRTFYNAVAINTSLVADSLNETKLGSENVSVFEYFKPRKEETKLYDRVFIDVSGQVCLEEESPTVVMICLTMYGHVEERNTIRSTWGSVISSKTWPNSNETFRDLKLIFLSGNPGPKVDLNIKERVRDELVTYKDIVIVDMNDTYRNLSLKVIVGLRWVHTYCPGAKFVVKVDEDTFVHVPNLLKYLNSLPIPNEGLISGYAMTVGIAEREKGDRFYISPDVYPFVRYPLYTAGCAYVISGNVLSRLTDAAKHMPYIGIADVFITGILREVVGAKILYKFGFTQMKDDTATPCQFLGEARLAGTNTDTARKLSIWEAVKNPGSMQNCFKICKKCRRAPDLGIPLDKKVLNLE